MNNSEKNQECPEVELLSAYMDGDESVSFLQLHLENCENCRNKIEAYRKIATAISEIPEPSVDFTARIQLACRANKFENQPLSKFNPVFGSLVRAAAAIVLIAVSLALFKTLTSKNGNDQTVSIDPVEDPTYQQEVNHMQAWMEENYSAYEDSAYEFVSDYGSGNNVLVSNPGNIRLQGININRQPIPENVVHVWSIPSKEKDNVLNSIKLTFPTSLVQEQEGGFDVEVRLPDFRVQQLADCLFNKFGAKLLSKSLPQPNKINLVSFNRSEVNYTMNFAFSD